MTGGDQKRLCRCVPGSSGPCGGCVGDRLPDRPVGHHHSASHRAVGSTQPGISPPGDSGQ